MLKTLSNSNCTMKHSTLLKLILIESLLNGNVDVKELLCGFVTKYDTETHDCDQWKVIPKKLACGTSWIKYNTETHICKNNSIISNNQTTEATLAEIPCRKSDLLDCKGNLFCGNKRLYKCCGVEIYRQDTQTCCRETHAKYIIHDHKPERKHICCGVDVYPRKNSKAPCQHSSRNDAFFSENLPRLQKKRRRPMICNNDVVFAYHLRITGEHNEGVERNLNATVTQYRRTRRGNVKRVKRIRGIKIPLDKYSPSRLRRKGFLILSNYQYLKDATFVRRYRDVVFKAQRKTNGLKIKLTEEFATCTTF